MADWFDQNAPDWFAKNSPSPPADQPGPIEKYVRSLPNPLTFHPNYGPNVSDVDTGPSYDLMKLAAPGTAAFEGVKRMIASGVGAGMATKALTHVVARKLGIPAAVAEAALEHLRMAKPRLPGETGPGGAPYFSERGTYGTTTGPSGEVQPYKPPAPLSWTQGTTGSPAQTPQGVVMQPLGEGFVPAGQPLPKPAPTGGTGGGPIPMPGNPEVEAQLKAQFPAAKPTGTDIDLNYKPIHLEKLPQEYIDLARQHAQKHGASEATIQRADIQTAEELHRQGFDASKWNSAPWKEKLAAYQKAQQARVDAGSIATPRTTLKQDVQGLNKIDRLRTLLVPQATPAPTLPAPQGIPPPE